MNPIIIEQNQDEIRLAFEVHENAAIDRFRLARTRVSSEPSEEWPKAPITVAFTFKSKPITAPSSVLRLEIVFRMVGVEETKDGKKDAQEKKPEDKKPKPVVLVECTYEVDYALREDFSITPEHVKAFKDGNAIFNAWPYFREYLQNNLQRMGLPALTAPFLRLQPKLKPENGRSMKKTKLPKPIEEPEDILKHTQETVPEARITDVAFMDDGSWIITFDDRWRLALRPNGGWNSFSRVPN